MLELIEREAVIDGTSTSQFIRDSAMMRVGFRMATRGEYDSPAAAVEELLRKARDGD